MATTITKTPITIKGMRYPIGSYHIVLPGNDNPLNMATEISQGAIMVATEFRAWVKFKRLEAEESGPSAVT